MFSGGHWKTTTNPTKVTVKTSDGSTGDLDSTSTDWECNYETFKSSETSTLIVSKTLTYRKLFAGLGVCKNGIAGAQMHVGDHTEKNTLKFKKKGSST